MIDVSKLIDRQTYCIFSEWLGWNKARWECRTGAFYCGELDEFFYPKDVQEVRQYGELDYSKQPLVTTAKGGEG